jgi:hypothetical protein
MVHVQLGTSTNGGGTVIGAAQPGVEQTSAAQLGAAQLCAATAECGYNWVPLQLGATTAG